MRNRSLSKGAIAVDPHEPADQADAHRMHPMQDDILRLRAQLTGERETTSATPSSPRSRSAPRPGSLAGEAPSADISVCCCKGAGFVVPDVPYGHPLFGKLVPCRCKVEELEERRAQQNAWRLSKLKAELGDLADRDFQGFDLRRKLAPLSYRGVTYPVSTQRRALAEAQAAGLAYASTLADATEPAGWFYCFGPVGGGKSHLAAAIANHAASLGFDVSYASVPRFLRFIKSGFSQISEETGGSEADERITALCNVSLLVLDDLGQEAMSRWDKATLFEVFDSRYRRKLPTVVTSMLHIEEIERIHEAVADRIRGMSRHTQVALLVSSIRAVEQERGGVKAS
jgi:DNA replication protein DnaC